MHDSYTRMLEAARLATKTPDIGSGELGRLLGESQQTVNNWKQRGVSSQGVVKLAEKLGISPAFITAGVGTMLIPSIEGMVDETDNPVHAESFVGRDVMYGLGRSQPRTSSADSSLRPILAWEHEQDLPAGEFVMIPRLDVRLSAGNGHEQVEIEFTKAMPQAFRAEWIREQKLKPSKLAAMTADGDSMEPAIFDGDSLLIDTSQTLVQDGRVYALWYDGGERVKRLFRLPGGGLRITSDNPQHPTIEVGAASIEHVRILGRVVHRSGRGGL
ncbi:LexA family transcriptional regulator [Hydrogenophaga sp. R2]|uniref:LexA family transcriptional regulator n=1 Tax=Hydrogenophaga sp. R2 TaxID=3132827 RepID=UPI003CED8300